MGRNNADQPSFLPIPYTDTAGVSGHTKLVNVNGVRPHVLAWVRGTKVPFYLSSGLGGKQSVESGKWYPHFGIGEDGWINKGPEDVINSYYHSPHLKHISEWLNAHVGDIAGDTDIPHVDSDSTLPHIKALNADMKPVTFSSEIRPQAHGNKVLEQIARNPRQPTQAERLQNSTSNSLLKKHAKEHPELNLGTDLP
jgi:hypothetical protein